MNNHRPTGSGKARTEVPVKLGSSIETVQEAAANLLYHALGVREFASNDHHVFLEVVIKSWTNSHRNEVELVMHVGQHGDSCDAN